MSFKSLGLKRELIEPSLKNYAESANIEQVQKPKFIEYKISLPNEDIALLHVKMKLIVLLRKLLKL